MDTAKIFVPDIKASSEDVNFTKRKGVLTCKEWDLQIDLSEAEENEKLVII